MCYGISLTKGKGEIEKAYFATFKPTVRFSSYKYSSRSSTPHLYCIPLENPSQICSMEWGMCPSWGERNNSAYTKRYKTVNINADSVFKSERYARLIRERRCLILGDSFFETAFKNSADTYTYYVNGRKLFSVAGIYDIYDENYSNVVMITTKPKKPIIHPLCQRKSLPMILDPDYETDWLNPTLNDTEIENLLSESFTKEDIKVHPVGLKLSQPERKTTFPEEPERIRKI